jgi:hypothetical protein
MTMTNYIKIIIATFIAIAVVGGFVFANNIPSETEKLIKFNEQLILNRQEEWKDIDLQIQELNKRKLQIEMEAESFRKTISIFKGEPIGVDFRQPLN